MIKARPARRDSRFDLRLRLRVARMHWGLLINYLKRRIIVIVGLTGLLIGVLGFFGPVISLITSLVGAGLAVVTWLYDISVVRKYESEFDLRYDEHLDFAATTPPTFMPSAETIHSCCGTAIRDDATDRLLRGDPIEVDVSPTAYALPSELRIAQMLMLKYSRKPYRLLLNGELVRLDTDVTADAEQSDSDSLLFNGKLVRLDTDVTADAVQNGTVTLRPARYFDALATNYLERNAVYRTSDGGRVVVRGIDLTVDDGGAVYSLAESKAANIIGVSTIATTRDGFLLVQRQGMANKSEPGKLVPSGSGSLDFSDIRRAVHPTQLQSIALFGMERELHEETGIPYSCMQSRLTGFARWVDHGAKPEFFGWTELSLTAAEVARYRPPPSEKRLVDQLIPTAFDPAVLLDKGAVAFVDDVGRGLSAKPGMPLLLSIRALQGALEDAGAPRESQV